VQRLEKGAGPDPVSGVINAVLGWYLCGPAASTTRSSWWRTRGTCCPTRGQAWECWPGPSGPTDRSAPAGCDRGHRGGVHLASTGWKLVRQAAGGLLDEEDPGFVQSWWGARVDEPLRIIRVHHLRAIRAGRFHHVDAHSVMPEFWA